MAYQTETTSPTKHSADELDTLYRESDECDKEIFSEQRSNILLIAGEHYQRKGSSFFKRIRSNRELSEQQKIRLTKNHTKRIIDEYVNNLLSVAPGVAVAPQNENEVQDQKAAELHQAVWRDAVERLGVGEQVDEWADDFYSVGEVATKIFWDPSIGPIKAYQQKTLAGVPLFLDEAGEETPDPGLDPFGQPTRQPAKGEPIRAGQFVFETIHGFNLLRDPCAKDMKKSEYLIYRKMVNVKELIKQFPDKKELIEPTQDETLVVFDASRGGYRKAENEVMVREFYFRPCAKYPEGYFFITVQGGVLAEGELPGGVFPIVFEVCRKIQTTPRGRSPVKQIRPYQAEINRMASKIAEHQITLGDDKLLLQNGSKLTAGVSQPGIRSYHYTGMKPEILEGRTGEQYLANLNATISELYAVMGVEEDKEQKADGNTDPFAMLFKAARQKKRFSRYLRRFENFLKNVAKTYLALAKVHLPDDAIIYAAGRREQVNIPEFRAMDDLCYQIKIEEQAEDLETKFGRQMVLNHTLQYVGNKLEKEDIGKIIRAMPYGNVEESFGDLTLDYDSVTNELLALDRGEIPEINETDNHVYAAKRLASRMRQADFRFLSPEIQANYQAVKQQHMQMHAQQLIAIQRAQSGFIPTDGYLVSCDFYIPKPDDPTKTQRAKVPYRALQWLIEQLEAQGQSLEQLEQMQQGLVAEMADMLQNPGMAANGMASMPAMGNEMPGGVANGLGESGSAWAGIPRTA